MSSFPPLKLCFIPFYGAPSHSYSLTNIARYFAFHGQKVTILATQYNDKLIQNLINNDNYTPSRNQIDVRITLLPFEELGLTTEEESFITPSKLYLANEFLRHSYEKIVKADCFDCIVSDSMFAWAADVASDLQIPCISFNPYSGLYECIREVLRSPDSPHHQIQSSDGSFCIPSLPFTITITKSELPPEEFLWFEEQIRVGELKCDFVLLNSFKELELDNMEYFSKVTNLKIMTIGPASEIDRKISGEIAGGLKVTENNHECLRWLDTKDPNSVLYICFGSIFELTDAQLMEIASALESSGHNFIWVAIRKEKENEIDEGKGLPIGFSEKIKDRGLVLKSWAPQLSILQHPSVGGFLTHCGWNSLMEGISTGVPMITWPLTCDQFCNEKLVTQVLGIGVPVGGNKWLYWYEFGKNIKRREEITLAIRRLMDDGEKTQEMRMRAQEYGRMAKEALDENGSSHRGLMDFIEEVRSLKGIKK